VGHKASAPSRPGGPEGKARKDPRKNHPKVKSTLMSGKTMAALKRQGKGSDPANSVGKGPSPLPPAGSDEEPGSEGEPDDAERNANLRAKWGLLDPPGKMQKAGASAPPGVTPKGMRTGLGRKAWGVALAIAQGLRDPLSVTRTDTQLIKKMELERRIGGRILPALRSRDARIRQARAEAQRQGPPIDQVSSPTGGRDIVTSREVGAAETLLVPFGVIRAKRVPVEWDPEGRRYLPMGTGGFLLISTQTWDAMQIPSPHPVCLSLEGDRFRNLAPFLQYAEVTGSGNCRWVHTESGCPVLVATQALAAGVRLRAEECVVECVEASPEEAEEGTREGSDSEDEIRLYGEGEEAAPISDVEGDGSDDVAEEPGAKRAPRPKVWSASRPYRAKQWVDELRLYLTGTQMWCYLTKTGNLNLCTINVNGKPMGWELQRLLLQLSNGSDCPIDGFVLIDTRTPEEQVGFQTREWQAVFGEKELVIRVLSGKHRGEGGRNPKING
jgi:hypothetical protein